MANKLKISELKSHLNELNQKELINLITELQKYSKDAETYLSVKFLGEAAIQEQHKQAKKEILDEFFPQKGFGKLRLTNAKKPSLILRN
ncbi:hypothetical protein [Piscibacillus salipiscarius]|uniref:hypothetical protein n=1 Tax=Piscibacillus salipiscarius TaxID=299480 RepID=UPI0006D0D127|nr:hypothetical protein [Piscibacillus salipiscarius]